MCSPSLSSSLHPCYRNNHKCGLWTGGWIGTTGCGEAPSEALDISVPWPMELKLRELRPGVTPLKGANTAEVVIRVWDNDSVGCCREDLIVSLAFRTSTNGIKAAVVVQLSGYAVGPHMFVPGHDVVWYMRVRIPSRSTQGSRRKLWIVRQSNKLAAPGPCTGLPLDACVRQLLDPADGARNEGKLSLGKQYTGRQRLLGN
ncbi:hypothetical protein BGZ57DRAFT_990751 [Hyaloscypha finlandica]|nr:hypothetical protein BGZ57DRAFT_990751 [Hyaloscypha finlandica]